jgi:hypothetical protein
MIEYATEWLPYPLPHDPVVVLAAAAGIPLFLALIIAFVREWLLQ